MCEQNWSKTEPFFKSVGNETVLEFWK